MKLKELTIAASIIALAACSTGKDIIDDNIRFASAQLPYMLELCEPTADTTLIPHSLKNDGTISFSGVKGWISGFLPGTLWYMYELTGDEYWKEHAIRHTENIRKAQYITSHHDVGFIISSSFGQGMRIAGMPGYDSVVVQGAKSLCTRFRPGAGIIQSWNVERGWQSKRGWKCPVIIDNMMNLEMLFQASRISGDSTYYNIAVRHADNTMANHYRPDFSCCHVVDYDPQTGEVRGRCTAQGFADGSAWSRGQSWGLYGYTMCYRYTNDRKYLDFAEKIAGFLLNHPHLPEDMVPYWDYDCTDIPNTSRDASAAAIMASALYELYAHTGKALYKEKADRIITSLSSPAYRSEIGANGGYLLLHSTSSVPHNSNIDKPLVYADYYLLEALLRKRNLESGDKQ